MMAIVLILVWLSISDRDTISTTNLQKHMISIRIAERIIKAVKPVRVPSQRTSEQQSLVY